MEQEKIAEKETVPGPGPKLATMLLVASIFVATLAPAAWIQAAVGHLKLPPAAQDMTHVLMFSALAALLLRAWPKLGLWRLLGLTLLLAGLTEALQHFAVGRHPSLEGVASDMAGVLLGLVGSAAIRATQSRPPRPADTRHLDRLPAGDE